MILHSDFSHYATHLLVDVYPLARAEFKAASLHRRASYSYINEIVEGAQSLAGSMLRRIGKTAPTTWTGSVRSAGLEGLLPTDLVESLLRLRTLRNQVVHENPVANFKLVAFERIPLVLMCGYALFEVWRASAWATDTQRSTPPPDILVDRDYALELLRSSVSPTAQAARAKLEKEPEWPSFAVSRSNIWARVRAT